MKNIAEIQSVFPDKNSNKKEYKQLKEKNPHYILEKWAKAFSEKYHNKLEGYVTFNSNLKTDGANTDSFTFYINAVIGSGYIYKLIELVPNTDNYYPLNIYLRNEQYKGQIQNAEELEETLLKIFQEPITKNIILNLLAQVDIYNESRTY